MIEAKTSQSHNERPCMRARYIKNPGIARVPMGRSGSGYTYIRLPKFLSFFNETNANDIYLVVLQQHLEIKSIQRSSTAMFKSSLAF